VDGAANHSATLPGSDPERGLLLGSHLDSVPNGGRFDGALGVVAALEVLRTIQDANLGPPVRLEAIDFTDEESRYLDYLGSQALTGKLGLEQLSSPHVPPEDFQDVLSHAGLEPASLLASSRAAHSLVGYLELHIEQGPRLAREGAHIGIATSIVGIRSYRVTFHGRADHSGTTPLDARRDAGLGAAAFSMDLDRLVRRAFPDAVATVGRMQFHPGSLNVVPRRVDVSVETRAPHESQLEELELAMIDTAEACGERHDLSLSVEKLGKIPAAPLDSRMRALALDAARAIHLEAIQMPSGAGHDAQVLAGFTPSALIFVPSISGISHNPKEFTPLQDCINGANVLLGATLRRLADLPDSRALGPN
jgi:N-carbamoyl-L-amino-acid hydrolase